MSRHLDPRRPFSQRGLPVFAWQGFSDWSGLSGSSAVQKKIYFISFYGGKTDCESTRDRERFCTADHKVLEAPPGNLSRPMLTRTADAKWACLRYVDEILFKRASLRENSYRSLKEFCDSNATCCYSRFPVDSIRLAVLTASPNKQYLGIFIPTTPAMTMPEWKPLLSISGVSGLCGMLKVRTMHCRSKAAVAISPSNQKGLCSKLTAITQACTTAASLLY